ncbi:DUF551 domain-containing protein [Enterobacter sp. CPE_E1214]|uniref:DUF551 domain-containing protein n=1 Tax=unclassified Enterobacter TaxID=2608935 RepID=UPI00388F0573
MSTITKERLQRLIRAIDSGNYDEEEIVGWVNSDEILELARIALASLEAEASGRNPVLAYADSYRDMANQGVESIPVWSVITDLERNIAPLFTAPPPPLSVPAAMEMDDNFDSAFEHGKAVGWNSYRAAMLQGADGTLTNEGTIPVTQFKPVADLYGLTSPTGCETSFTFDAVEARDFIDGGWSCQEYVELERFQEAITNHTEDKLAMVDHSGDSNNMVEPVTTAYKLPDDFDFDRFNDVVWLEAVASNPHMHSLTTSIIAMVALELNRKLADCNSPVIPDGWVACSERMPEVGSTIMVFMDKPQHSATDYAITTFDKYGFSRAKVTHWQPLPAAPQQEVKP